MKFFQLIKNNADSIIGVLGLLSSGIGFFNIRDKNKRFLSSILIIVGLTIFSFKLLPQVINLVQDNLSEDTSISNEKPSSVSPTSIPTISDSDLEVENTPIVNEKVSPEPLRPHFDVYVGSGIFETSSFSDGMAEYSYEMMENENRLNIQRIIQEEYQDGCDIARFDSDVIWITGSKGTKLSINDEIIGEYLIADDPHGYIVSYPVKFGDKICVVDFKPSGFAIFLGPDIYYHYDSLCYRGFCN